MGSRRKTTHEIRTQRRWPAVRGVAHIGRCIVCASTRLVKAEEVKPTCDRDGCRLVQVIGKRKRRRKPKDEPATPPTEPQG